MEQDELKEQYMGLSTTGQIVMDPRYGQMSCNHLHSNAFVLNQGHNPKIFLVELMTATDKGIIEHIHSPAKLIAASRIEAGYTQLLIIIHRLWMVLKRVKERRDRRMVGKRMILVLM
jgi:hypothetical protein